MNRNHILENVIRQYIREATLSFNYGNIGIGQSSEAAKNSYVKIALQYIGLAFAAGAVFYAIDNWNKFVQKITDAYDVVTGIPGKLDQAVSALQAIPAAITNFQFPSLPGTSPASTTTAPAAPASSAASSAGAPATGSAQTAGVPQQEALRRFIREALDSSTKMGCYSTPYGPLIDTNFKDIATKNIKQAQRIPKILPTPKLKNRQLTPTIVGDELGNTLNITISKLRQLNVAGDKNKDYMGLANSFGITGLVDTETLIPVDGATSAQTDAQRQIAKMFMTDIIVAYLYDKIITEVLENIGYALSTRPENQSAADKVKFDAGIDKFINELYDQAKTSLKTSVQSLLGGGIFSK